MAYKSMYKNEIARAAFRLKSRGDYGAKTMIELAPIDLLAGDPESLVKALV